MAGYGTDQGFTDWLTANGFTTPVSAPASAVLRQRGSAYIDSIYGGYICGYPTGGSSQERIFPVTGGFIGNLTLDPGAIPAAVVNASYRAAYLEAVRLGALSSTSTPGTRVKKQKAGPIEREFFEDAAATAGGGVAVIDSEIDGMMRPFLCLNDTSIIGIHSVG